MATYGEDLVANLLNKLPKGKYFIFREPKIVGINSAHQHADFVIVSAQLGVVVIEVKDWTNIQTIRQKTVVLKRPNGQIEEETNPLITAREYALNLADRFQKRKELLIKRGGKNVLTFPWMYKAILTHVDNQKIRECEELGIWNKGEVLGKGDLAEERFEKVLSQNTSPRPLPAPPLSDAIVNIIRGVIDPSLIVQDSTGNDVGTLTMQQEQLVIEPLRLKDDHNPKQKLLIDDEFLTSEVKETSESSFIRLVRGVAGSGKSLVLARRARFLAETYPDLSILVMAFNVDLVTDLKRRISNTQHVQINNFHKVCSQILRGEWHAPSEVEGWLNNRFPNLVEETELTAAFVAQEIQWRKEVGLYDNNAYLEASREGRGKSLNRKKREIINTIFSQYLAYQTRTGSVDWADIPHRVLEKMKSDPNSFEQFDAILVDEAQDFAPSWIKIATNLLKPGGNLFICDDPTQSLFRSFSWKQKGVDVVGRTRILKIPFRCTKEITLAAYSLVEADSILSGSEEITKPDLESYELPSGEQPKLSRYTNLDQEIKEIAQSACKLVDSGVAPQSVAILCHSKRLVKHWAYLRDKGFYVESFLKMKGLEFNVVYIPHVQDVFESVNLKDDGEIAEKRRQVFTAMTRARQILLMSYFDTFPPQLSAIKDYVVHDDVSGFKR